MYYPPEKKKNKNKFQNRIKAIIPWAYFVDEGIVMLKHAAIMTTFRIDLPDLEATSAESVAGLAELFNRNIMSLASTAGWGIQFDVNRKKTKKYPSSDHTNLCGWLIDQRRAENFSSYGEHFISEIYINFVYQLPGDLESKAENIIYGRTKDKKKDSGKKNLSEMQKHIEMFKEEVLKVMGTIGTKIRQEQLDSSAMLTYLKSCVSMNEQNMTYPKGTFFFLDDYLVDMGVKNSIPLKIGEYYAPVISIMDLPSETYPAIFDRLNRTMMEFRWTTRYIPLDKEMSLKEADRYQKKMYSSRKSAGTLFAEYAMNMEIDREDAGSLSMESEAKTITADITMGHYLLGYYTTTLMVWDKKLSVAKERSRKLQQIVRSCGFTTISETFNCAEAWAGMMPGNMYSNIRKPFISTVNLSHLIPLSSAWLGQYYNQQLDEWCGSGVPLVTCSTSYGTPFFLNLNVKDVGNTFIFGPVGSGKSTLLALLMASALKYKDANIICIDKQLSSRAFMIASGGTYIEPGKDEISFQPLSELLSPDECSSKEYSESLLWCQQFIEGLLSQQNIETTPEMSNSIRETLILLSQKDKSMRDLTSFQGYVNYTDPRDGSNTIKLGLNPYCSGGTFGTIFDGENENIRLSKLMTIEMGSLMKLSEKAVAPALMYIFRYLEKIWNVGHGEKQPVTFLFLDEAWLYLNNSIFASYLQEWLRTLRKKRVFVIFATQEVSAAANSPLRDTIAQQCKTKIYLADESATSPALVESYRYFGLTDTEILALSEALAKRDYFFKNPLGCRMFSLDLDAFQLALLTSDHELLDRLEDRYGKNTGRELAFELLEETKKKYIQNGQNPQLLDATKYQKMISGENE